ncbi:MAG TPA: hypothetical protein VFK79_10840 [Xanthobacteraceae bacterium]|nr:hypothetical protein [Xanthobacteraceae bacterium]
MNNDIVVSSRGLVNERVGAILAYRGSAEKGRFRRRPKAKAGCYLRAALLAVFFFLFAGDFRTFLADDFRAFLAGDFRAFLTFFLARFRGRRLRARVRISTTSAGATAKAGRIAARSSCASSISSAAKSIRAAFFLFAISFAPPLSLQYRHSCVG